MYCTGLGSNTYTLSSTIAIFILVAINKFKLFENFHHLGNIWRNIFPVTLNILSTGSEDAAVENMLISQSHGQIYLWKSLWVSCLVKMEGKYKYKYKYT